MDFLRYKDDRFLYLDKKRKGKPTFVLYNVVVISMSVVGIHQPHFFPWMGYLNKIAQSDVFIVLDEAQIEKGSNMYRNKLVTIQGIEKYITISYQKKDALLKKNNEIEIDKNVDWQQRQKSFLYENYKQTKYYDEIMGDIDHIYSKEYNKLIDVLNDSINYLLTSFGIKTKIVYQSTLEYDRFAKRNELLIELCKAVNCDCYLSGNSARKYMDINLFEHQGISVEFQEFKYPVYDQGKYWVPNLSSLDILFREGKEASKQLFWENMNDSKN